MPASTLTMPEALRAKALYESGRSQPQVAWELGRSRKEVRTALKAVGVTFRTRADGYRTWLDLRGGKGPHDGGKGSFKNRPDVGRGTWFKPGFDPRRNLGTPIPDDGEGDRK